LTEVLRDRLIRGEVDLANLAIEGLEHGIKKPGGSDLLPLTAAAILRELGEIGIDLTSLPPDLPTLGALVYLGWYEREDDQLVRARRDLANTEAWDDDRASAEADQNYRRGCDHHAEQLERYGAGLDRARKLRQSIIAMDMNHSAEISADTGARLLALQADLLAQADLAIYQLESWIGEPPVRMGGAEYKRHLIAGYTKVIEKALGRGTKDGRVAEAFALLQALVPVLYTS
jgi:hypothetical protein